MSGKGREVVFLGLAFENLNRLREGEPILIRGEDLKIDHDIMIHAGKNEASILAELRQHGALPDEMVKPKPMCPDDNTELKWGPLRTDMYCPQCDRRFGVIDADKP